MIDNSSKETYLHVVYIRHGVSSWIYLPYGHVWSIIGPLTRNPSHYFLVTNILTITYSYPYGSIVFRYHLIYRSAKFNVFCE